MKRFGSILGRGGNDDAKKLARQQRLSSIGSPQPQASAPIGSQKLDEGRLAPNGIQQNESMSQDSDTPLAVPPNNKGVTRAHTTAADTSPSSLIRQQQHSRGDSIDTSSPTSRRSAGPPLADRRRQASMSVAHRRPKTAGTAGAEQAVPEVDEEAQPDAVGLDGESPDSSVATDSKPVYLKVCRACYFADVRC